MPRLSPLDDKESERLEEASQGKAVFNIEGDGGAAAPIPASPIADGEEDEGQGAEGSDVAPSGVGHRVTMLHSVVYPSPDQSFVKLDPADQSGRVDPEIDSLFSQVYPFPGSSYVREDPVEDGGGGRRVVAQEMQFTASENEGTTADEESSSEVADDNLLGEEGLTERRTRSSTFGRMKSRVSSKCSTQ